jgi:hypothetical protein
MEKESRISYEDMKGLAEAMSEVAERLVPGMSLFYREWRLRRGSWDSFDSKELAVVKTCPDGDAVPVRGAIIEIGREPYGRKKLLRRLAADGWPEARSPEEMKLKLAAAGDGAFEGVCRRYADVEYPAEETGR